MYLSIFLYNLFLSLQGWIWGRGGGGLDELTQGEWGCLFLFSPLHSRSFFQLIFLSLPISFYLSTTLSLSLCLTLSNTLSIYFSLFCSLSVSYPLSFLFSLSSSLPFPVLSVFYNFSPTLSHFFSPSTYKSIYLSI